MNLTETSKTEIDRMSSGGSLLRIAYLWFGIDKYTTVANLYYVTNKRVRAIPALRAEAASAFTDSKAPIDSVQIELILHYSKFSSHLAKLFALSQITPVIPVMNPLIASILQPLDLNKEVYIAYGYKNLVDRVSFENIGNTNSLSKDIEEKNIIRRLYSSVPVQTHIDSIHVGTIKGSPRDLRVIIRITRVATANIYGECVKYVESLDDTIKQTKHINKILDANAGSDQMRILGNLMGTNTENLLNMIESVNSRGTTFESETWQTVNYNYIISGNVCVVKHGITGKNMMIKLAGISVPECGAKEIGHTKTEPRGNWAKKQFATILENADIIEIRKSLKQLENSDITICSIRTSKGEGNLELTGATLLQDNAFSIGDITELTITEQETYSNITN